MKCKNKREETTACQDVRGAKRVCGNRPKLGYIRQKRDLFFPHVPRPWAWNLGVEAFGHSKELFTRIQMSRLHVCISLG